ncbi:hypothetical protein MKY34_01665 [Sporosarcina sp. FSL K6-1522]|uniref:hypothetical protein n=1 Tax=Sporosarcina sp. FSL K6-1522 TaxID=2921554 RepID=UPI00315A9E4A
MNFKCTDIQMLDDNGSMIVHNGILVEGDELCAIYNVDDENFKFVYTTRFELSVALATQGLRMKDSEEEERLCSECGAPMQEGFCFESDASQYCSEKCLTKVITWGEYLNMHDNGNGDAYWADWGDC